MLRQLSSATRLIATAAILAVPTISLAQTDTRPVVVVYRFDNNAVGTGRADFDGMAGGIQELLITELASSGKIRLVDRSHLNEVLVEHNLAKTGQIDSTTAVRIGRILGAQYAITGGFISVGKDARLTSHVIDIETTQIINPQKVAGKTDDVLKLIDELSTKVASGNLMTKPGISRPAEDKGKSSTGVSQTGKASKDGAQEVVFFSRQVPTDVVKKSMNSGLDPAGLRLFNSALDAMDAKDKAKAKTLFAQISSKYPDFEPAKTYLAKVS